MLKEKPKEMTGAELASMLKSSINFKSLGGVKCDSLKLSKGDMQWWHDAKIGMFIHWGLYSILGRGEWVRHNEQIPWEEYTALANEFNPQDFSPSEWIDLAKDFGAQYTVLTARHHDGFALWNSAGSYNGFTAANSAAHRDFVREYVDAARAQNIKTGLYYSPMDWRFPGYFDPTGLPESAAELKKQCYAQVEELNRDYGPLDIFWYDGAWLAHKGSDTSSAWFWEPEKLNAILRQYSPKAVVNPRSGWEGDFYCDEGSHEISGKIIPVPWEKNMCVCSGTSWGWMPSDPVSDFDWLIKMLANVICRGGNWLLNIGPDKNGKLPTEVIQRMKQLGQWIKQHEQAIYKTRGGPFEPVDNVYGSVYRENHVYLHILDVNKFSQLMLPPYSIPVSRVSLLSGEECGFSQNADGIKILLPENIPHSPDTVVEILLEQPVPEQESERIYFTGK